MVQPKPNIEGYNTLQHVTFTGCTKYFDHMEIFFTTFGSTIKSLTINIDLMYYIVDGKRLEYGLLNKMPYLSSLDLIIHSTAAYCDRIEIETFQTSTWQKFNPVVYWNDIHAHQHTIFTLPYKFDRVRTIEYHFSTFFLIFSSNIFQIFLFHLGYQIDQLYFLLSVFVHFH
jgi:hypothetical protein